MEVGKDRTEDEIHFLALCRATSNATMFRFDAFQRKHFCALHSLAEAYSASLYVTISGKLLEILQIYGNSFLSQRVIRSLSWGRLSKAY